jgi:acyl-CoA reductase-like NAD-dependent aldehyde dehydrogenase
MKALVLNALGRGFAFEDAEIAAPNGMTGDPQAPWGGFKYSGVGREHGRYGIEAFLETRPFLSPKEAHS